MSSCHHVFGFLHLHKFVIEGVKSALICPIVHIDICIYGTLFQAEFLASYIERFFWLLVMQGNILYRFPSLQRTASSQRSGKKEYVGRKWPDWVGGVEKFFKERKWQFRQHFLYNHSFVKKFTASPNICSLCSKTSTSERAMVIGLGGLNLFGVIILGTMLKYVAITIDMSALSLSLFLYLT